MMTSSYVIHSDLLAMAPERLWNGRIQRYHGDDLAVSLHHFVEADQKRIRYLYAFLQRSYGALQDTDSSQLRALGAFLTPGRVGDLVDQIAHLGEASYDAHPTPLMGKAIHDIRGGGLTPLLCSLQFGGLSNRLAGCRDTLYFLTRDHLKIMRNALLGLDDAARLRDLAIKPHGIDLIIEKWNGASFHGPNGNIRVQVECPERVTISECCVEFGAFDRILYNLFNNACRHAADENVQMVLFPIPEGRRENLRVVVINALSPSDQDHLEKIDLRTLFRPEVSTTGSG